MQTFHAHLYPTGSKWQVEVTPDLPVDDHEELLAEDPTGDAEVVHVLDVPASAPPAAAQAAAERALLSAAGAEWHIHRWDLGNGEMLGWADRERPYSHRGQVELHDGQYRLVIRRPISLVLADNTADDDVVFDDLAEPVVIPLPGLTDMEDVAEHIQWMARTHGWHVVGLVDNTGHVQALRERPRYKAQITHKPDGTLLLHIFGVRPPRPQGKLPTPPAEPDEDPRATAERAAESELRRQGFRLISNWARRTATHRGEPPYRTSEVHLVCAGEEGLGPLSAPLPAPAGWVTDRLRTAQDVARLARTARTQNAAGRNEAWEAWDEARSAVQAVEEGLPTDYLADVASATEHALRGLIEEAVGIIEQQVADDADRGIWKDPAGWDDDITVAEFVRGILKSAIWDAAQAAAIRDKISAEHYAVLTKPFHQDEP